MPDELLGIFGSNFPVSHPDASRLYLSISSTFEFGALQHWSPHPYWVCPPNLNPGSAEFGPCAQLNRPTQQQLIRTHVALVLN